MRSLTTPILSVGTLLDVHVGVSDARRRVLVRHQRPVPPPVVATFLVDTGASNSLVDEALMRTLELTPTSSTAYHSSSTNGVAQRCDVYDVQLVLGGIARPTTLRFDPLAIMATVFINHPFAGLLGRDILNRVQLGWNGPTKILRIEYQ